MRKGEIATLICGPQYAFGEPGAPPKIPPNATVETRLELAGWLDLAAEYNAVPGKVETDDELRERWSEDLAEGTSPMKDEAGHRRFFAFGREKACSVRPRVRGGVWMVGSEGCGGSHAFAYWLWYSVSRGLSSCKRAIRPDCLSPRYHMIHCRPINGWRCYP